MSLLIHKPGMLTTVQDEGRWGYQNMGVPVSGPMDRVSHRLANLLVGNPRRAATLEVTLLGPDIEFERDVLFAVAGADFALQLDGAETPMAAACPARQGSRLRFGARRRGARAYLAVAGGIDVPPVLGSRATHVASRTGGLAGRPLTAGDRLPLGESAPPAARPGPRRRARPLPDGGARLRVIPGPEDDRFTAEGLRTFSEARYRITPESNRIGYRLEGPVIERRSDAEILSEATPIGSLQVPASGQPIVLMADCQTSGGYPRIATVISADLAIAGQLAPGDWIEFEPCERSVALTALVALERDLME